MACKRSSVRSRLAPPLSGKAGRPSKVRLPCPLAGQRVAWASARGRRFDPDWLHHFADPAVFAGSDAVVAERRRACTGARRHRGSGETAAQGLGGSGDTSGFGEAALPDPRRPLRRNGPTRGNERKRVLAPVTGRRLGLWTRVLARRMRSILPTRGRWRGHGDAGRDGGSGDTSGFRRNRPTRSQAAVAAQWPYPRQRAQASSCPRTPRTPLSPLTSGGLEEAYLPTFRSRGG